MMTMTRMIECMNEVITDNVVENIAQMNQEQRDLFVNTLLQVKSLEHRSYITGMLMIIRIE